VIEDTEGIVGFEGARSTLGRRRSGGAVKRRPEFVRRLRFGRAVWTLVVHALGYQAVSI
jgi:hypothetical protein